jgi:hypothetical protein
VRKGVIFHWRLHRLRVEHHVVHLTRTDFVLIMKRGCQPGVSAKSTGTELASSGYKAQVSFNSVVTRS